MNELDVTAVMHHATLVMLKLCSSLLLAPLVSGVATSVFQAITQISDSTLSFFPKLCATLAVAYYTGPFISRTLADFMHLNLSRVVLVGGQ